ncbi:PDDEXK nuclease domain-containing protein [Myxococcota bacterium]|nr:PDDEXK nuclease domain-containing protein [Myxococcota bacterium]
MDFPALVADIAGITRSSQEFAARTADRLLTLRSWLIGAWIVEYEQHGEDRSTYGDGLIERLAENLERDDVRGLSPRNLMNFRQLALTWPDLDAERVALTVLGPIRQTASADFDAPEIPQTLSAESALAVRASAGFPSLLARATSLERLPWQDAQWTERLFSALTFSHLLELSRVDVPLKRAFYELQLLKEGWSVRELKRQVNSMLYERVGLSRDKDAVMALSREGRLMETPATILRDPYVLEFLGLPESTAYSEAALESALLDHLQEFLRELGRDFCFVDRQLRITVGGEHHHLDLLFFHRGLRCLVAIELKIGEFDHRDAGQMHFYLNWIAENLTKPDEAPPVGLLLCAGKDEEKVHYATANLPRTVFVSRYLTVLPSETLLARWLHEERERLARGRGA